MKKHLLRYGDAVLAHVNEVSVIMQPRRSILTVSFDYNGKKRKIDIDANRTVTNIKRGDTIVLFVEPENPESALVYDQVGYRIVSGA